VYSIVDPVLLMSRVTGDRYPLQFASKVSRNCQVMGVTRSNPKCPSHALSPGFITLDQGSQPLAPPSTVGIDFVLGDRVPTVPMRA
jgi:hypothetical protein